MADLDRAIQIDPTYADAHHGRGLYRQALGDRQGALADFQRAADLYQSAGNTRRYQETMERIATLNGNKNLPEKWASRSAKPHIGFSDKL